MLSRLRLIHRNQKGLTLVGLIMAISVTGIISVGITTTIFQMFDHSGRSTARMTAVKQLESASLYINRDSQMAQTVEPADPDPDGFPLTLTWIDWDNNNEYQVVFTLIDDKLKREHYTNRATNPTPDATSSVARYIDPDECSCSWDDTTGKLTFTLTTAVGYGSKESSETRTWEVVPRPSS